MEEGAYWTALEFRVCREFDKRDKRKHYWCDGFIPWNYCLEEDTPYIEGEAWLEYFGPMQKWKFILIVEAATSREEVDWEKLLPAEECSGWLLFDLDTKVMTINPQTAVAD